MRMCGDDGGCALEAAASETPIGASDRPQIPEETGKTRPVAMPLSIASTRRANAVQQKGSSMDSMRRGLIYELGRSARLGGCAGYPNSVAEGSDDPRGTT